MALLEFVVEMVSLKNVLIFLAAFLCFVVLNQLIFSPYFFSPLRKVPGPSLGNLFVGQAKHFVSTTKDPGIIWREWADKYGPVIRVVGPVGIERLSFFSPDALQRILVGGWAEYPRPDYLRNILGLVAGHGLLTVTGDVHRQMRKAMNPAFSIPNLMAQTEMYYDPIYSLVDILSAQISAQPSPSEGKQFLMYEWLSKATLDIISLTAFGYRTDSLHDPTNELAHAYENLIALQSGPNLGKLIVFLFLPGGARLLNSELAYTYRKWLRNKWFFGGIFKDVATLVESMTTIRRVSKTMLDQKLREEQFNSAIAEGDMEIGGKKDVMSLLVRAKAEHDRGGKGGYGMSDEAMMDQVLTFLGAGHETTASGLAWTLYLLATHPAIQAQLREEVTPIFSGRGRPDYRALKDLKWLDGVIMESLRLFTPVPLTVRRAATTDYVEGVLVPKGTMLTISIRAVNTWKEIWGDDAEEFKPSRWVNESIPKSQFSFLSFIAGPHGCIGKTMAVVEMKAVVAALVAHFTFESAYEGQRPKPAAAITMKPADGMPLRVKKVALSFTE